MAIILNNIKTLVGGSGVSLPSLANPGTKEDLMLNKQLIDGNGNKITGTMPNNGAISKTMDGLNTKSVSIPAGYTSGGTVSLTNDIDNIADTQSSKIAQIKTALESKAAGGGGVTLETCTLQIIDVSDVNGVGYTTVGTDGAPRYVYETGRAQDKVITCLRNSCVVVRHVRATASYISTVGCELFYASGTSSTAYGFSIIGVYGDATGNAQFKSENLDSGGTID